MTAAENKLTPKSMTSYWIQQMDYAGCSPKNQTMIKKIKCYTFLMCNNIIVALLTLNAIFTDYESIGHLAENLIITLGFVQEVIKFITGIVKAKMLSKMLDIMWNEFWPLRYTEEHNQKKIIKIYKFLNLVAKIYRLNVVGATTFFIIGTVITGNKSLPLDIWIPHKNILLTTPFYEITFVLELMLTFGSALFCLIPLDALFIIMIGVVYGQFKMLKAKLLKVGNTNDDYNLVKECVAHHNLLLNFLEMLEQVYSSSILPIIGSNLCLSALSMYAIVMEPTPSRRFILSFVFIGVFVQLYCYCQAGQFIQDEAGSMGNAAYNTNWVKIKDRRVKMSLILIIIRAQKTVNITMGGFMILSLESFSTVVRASFSFLTFLENMKS